MTAEVEEKPLVRQPALQFQHRIVDEQPPRNSWMKLAGDFDGLLERLLAIDTVEILPAGRALAKYAA